MTEGAEPRRFPLTLRDEAGAPIAVECTATRFATRDRTLALILARAGLAICRCSRCSRRKASVRSQDCLAISGRKAAGRVSFMKAWPAPGLDHDLGGRIRLGQPLRGAARRPRAG